MRIIVNEIKKMFSVRIILLLALITFIISKMFIGFWIENFPNGYPETQNFDLSVDMLGKYGTTIEEDEFKEFEKETALREKEADDYLINDKDAQKLGIDSYKELQEEESKYKGRNEEINALSSRIMFEENQYLFWELQARESMISCYRDMIYGTDNNTSEMEERIKEIESSPQINSVLSYEIMDNYNTLISNFSVLLVISIAFIISPIFLRDNKNKVNLLQCSSKLGRKIASKKIIASMVVTFLMTTLEIGGLFALYAKNNTLQFWNCSMNSRFSSTIYWFDLTFGEYIILSIILMYMVAFIVASLSLFVSSKVSNYVGLIGVQVPILGGLIMFLMKLGMFNITVLWKPKYIIHISYGILLIISILMLVNLIKKEKYKDILN